jgi:TolB-like protein
VRRFAGVSLLCASLVLMGVATPSPRPPMPSPKPSPTIAPAFSLKPSVIVFPFESPSDVDPKYGSAIAKIYVQTFNNSGGLHVLPVPSAPVKQADYLSTARAQHADYYVSGYVQPIGSEASIVAHIVDVSSDITVYSTTTLIASVPDVTSQALNARTVIMQSSGEDVSAVAPSTAPNTPAPSSTSGASVSISNVLGGLFKGKGKPVVQATPSPKQKPSRGVIVVRVSGNASAGDLSIASDDLYRAMSAYYATRLAPATVTNVAASASSLCGPHRDNTIATGTLDVDHVGGFRPHDVYTFKLAIYACFGVPLYTVSKTDPNRVKVVQEAVKEYADSHPENNG